MIAESKAASARRAKAPLLAAAVHGWTISRAAYRYRVMGNRDLYLYHHGGATAAIGLRPENNFCAVLAGGHTKTFPTRRAALIYAIRYGVAAYEERLDG